MLLFVSDLHLTDTKERSSFSPGAFCRSLEEVLRSATSDKVKQVELVLLGDILELLKSKRWLDDEVRPWETAGQKHKNTVAAIARDVFAANTGFFDTLKTLRQQYPLTISYYPGNHDGALNTSMGDGCRKELRDLLGIANADDRLFEPRFDNPEHRVVAAHGHEWDRENRYWFNTVAIGDFVVIDVVARLPPVLAKHLSMEEDDPYLEFAHQLDDVIPQTLNARIKWLIEGVNRLTRIHGARSMRRALGDIAEELEKRMRGHRFESEAGKLWVSILKHIMPGLGLMNRVTSLRQSQPHDFVDEAHQELFKADAKTEYVLFGHTHIPEYRTISGTPVKRYLNIGTWRRAHRRSDITNRKSSAFVTTNVGAMAVLRSPEEARSMNRPRHELRQFFYV